MRGKLSDQDLTDYALNELDPAERLYVESMLAVSEECRNDVYEMIDTAMMIEEGFDRQENGEEWILTADQRAKLLDVKMPNRFLRHTAAVLAAAAAVALAFVQRDLWMPKNSATAVSEVARVSSQVSNYVVEIVANADREDFVHPLATFKKLADEPVLTKWLPSQPVANPNPFGPAPSLNLEASPRGGLDFNP